MSIVKMVLGVKISWTTFDMDIHPLRGRACLFALHETANWEASEVDVSRCVCYCGDSGRSFHVKSARCVVRGNAMSGTLECSCAP